MNTTRTKHYIFPVTAILNATQKRVIVPTRNPVLPNRLTNNIMRSFPVKFSQKRNGLRSGKQTEIQRIGQVEVEMERKANVESVFEKTPEKDR